MSQIYFSQPLRAGQTSSTFLPPVNTGNAALLLTCTRDAGLKLADGTYAINQPATVTVRQLAADNVTQVTLVSGNHYGASSVEMLQPNQNGGVISIYNAGPGDLTCVSVSDLDAR